MRLTFALFLHCKCRAGLRSTFWLPWSPIPHVNYLWIPLVYSDCTVYPSTVLRIRDVDPGSKKRNKREGLKKFVGKPFFVAINFTKLKIILFLKCWRKIFWPVFKELLNFLSKNYSLSSKKYGFFRDPGTYSGSGSRGQKGTGSATLPFNH